MQKPEIAKLLTYMAVLDKRTLGTTDVDVWADILPAEILYEDALEGVKAHFREERSYLQPRDVIQRSLTAAANRVRKAGTPDFPPGLTWVQEREWRQLWVDLVHSGQEADKAKAIADAKMGLPRRAELVVKPADVRLAIEGMFQGPRQKQVYDPATEETGTDFRYGESA